MKTNYFALLILALLAFACSTPDKQAKTTEDKKAKNDTVVDSTTVRVLKEYFSNGKVKTEITAKGTLRHGLTRNYDRNGILLSEVNFVNNIREGMAKNFYPSGKMNSSMIYVNGIKEGDEIWYYESEKPFRVNPFVKGKIHGMQLYFHEDGKRKAELPFKEVFPGVGLKEYKNDDSLIDDYPSLVISQKNHMVDANKVILDISLSEPDVQVKFYRGKLTDGKYLNDDLLELATQNGFTRVDFNVAPGSAINQTVVITASIKTKRGTTLILSRNFKVNAVNNN
jgi:hypothetical protein